MESVSELCRRNTDDLREYTGEVIRVTKTNSGSNLRDAFIGIAERVFGKFQANLMHIDINVDADAALEDTA